MKPIHKKQEPAIFSAWKALANEDWQPSYAILSNPEKKAVKDARMQEHSWRQSAYFSFGNEKTGLRRLFLPHAEW